MSYCFRDLESAGDDQRKSAILLALVASLDDMRKHNQAESRKFGELFIPLFNAVLLETKRRATASLSRCPFVPANVCEFLCLQTLEISAPFLAHSPSLTNAGLCYVIAKTDESYAKIIAKRHELNKRVVQSLLAVNDAGVNRALQLRGYVGDASIHMDEKSVKRIDISHKVVGEADGSADNYGRVEYFDNIDAQSSPVAATLVPELEINKENIIKAGDVELFAPLETNSRHDVIEVKTTKATPKFNVTIAKRASQNQTEAETHVAQQQTVAVDPEAIEDEQFAAEEHLRQTLRDLVQGDLTGEEATLIEEHYAKHSRGNSADEAHPFGNEYVAELETITLPIHIGEIAHRRHILMMSKHIDNNHTEYFTTALADAIGSSVELSERIMGDMSGRQLATTFNAILAPQDMCIDALNKFFPHTSIMEGTKEGAEEMLQELQHGASLQRLMTWLKADILTRGHDVNQMDLSEANVDYSKITSADMPYVTPVADNMDAMPTWTNDQDMDNKDQDWLKAIGE